MTKKRVLSFALVLAMLIGIFAVIPSVGAVSATPVKLIYAKPVYRGMGLGAQGYVEVENIAYTKNITIHYTIDNETWSDCFATYLQPTHGNYEAWSFETPIMGIGHRGHGTITFAIKYEVEVNGSTQTYWDNNNGQNYSVAAGYSTTSRYDIGNGGAADFYSYRYSDTQVQGAVQLKNLAYEKVVKIVYTTDNWATTNEAYASYTSTFEENSNIEIWNYSFDAPTDEITYKIEYTVNGTTYVDDNFGNYYTI